MRLSVLGPLEVVADHGERLSVRRGLPRTLLHLLALRPREPVSVAALVDRMWETDPPADAANSVHRVVSYLRRTLGEAGRGTLVTGAYGYSLQVDDAQLDARRFEALAAEAADSTPRSAVRARERLAHADRALALWRGEPLADVATHGWALPEITRLTELYLLTVEARFAALLALGRHREVAAQAQAPVRAHPLREQLRAQLVLALYRSGRQGEALGAYADGRRILAEELGLDPGEPLRRLEPQILSHAPELDWTPLPEHAEPAPGAEARPGPRPARHPVTPPRPTSPTHQRSAPAVTRGPAWDTATPVALIGREHDLVAADDALRRTRLLTLVGPGGVGKTSLARALVARVTDRPVRILELDRIEDGRLIASGLAALLGRVVAPGQDPASVAVEALGDRPGLLLLDGCERVVEAVSALASRLLRDCPALTLVATSRAPLAIAGESRWPVAPLTTPTGDASFAHVRSAPAVRLFVDRARAVRPDFALTPANHADVAALVRALDGLPLAIELAAAQVDVAGPATLRRRLVDRFALLVGTVRDVPARQSTLHATISASVALLTPAQRAFFVRLSVFAGVFDLDGTAAVAVDVATSDAADGAARPDAVATAYRTLAALVRQSLVTVTGEDRYRLLESVRAYATQELAAGPDEAVLRHRHATYVWQVAAHGDVGLRGPAQASWLTRLRDLTPDVRAALTWSFGSGDPTLGASIAGALSWFWTLDGQLAEAYDWLGRAVAAPVTDARTRAVVQLGLGRLAAPLGRLAQAREQCALAVETARQLRDDALTGAALVTLGITEWALGRLDAAAVTHEEAAIRLADVGDEVGGAAALVLRARTAVDAGEAGVEERLDRALGLARRSGEGHVLALALCQRARLALLTDRYDEAAAAARTMLDECGRLGYDEGAMGARNLWARALVGAGKPGAADLLVVALRTARDLGHLGGLCETVESYALLAAAGQRPEEAVLLSHVAADRRSAAGLPIPPADRRLLASAVGAAAERLAPDTRAAIRWQVDVRSFDAVVAGLLADAPSPAAPA